MKHVFLYLSIALSLGIVAGKLLPDFLIILFVFEIGLIAALWCLRRTRAFLSLLLVNFFVLGMISFQLTEKTTTQSIVQIIKGKDGFRGYLVGKVIKQPEEKIKGKSKSLSFVMESQSFYDSKNKERHQVFGKVQVFLRNTSFIPRVGNIVEAYGTLKIPQHALNPGQFDYKKFLANKNIHTVLFGYGDWSLRFMSHDTIMPWVKGLLSIRKDFSHWLRHSYSEKVGGLYQALLLGIRKSLNPDIRETFAKVGVAHLLAISGLHVALLSGSLFLVFLILGIPQRVNALICLGLISAYVVLSGGAIPIQRASTMVGVALIAILCFRRLTGAGSLSFAYFILLLANPRNLFALGFQLSFLSVAVMVFLLRGVSERWRWGGDSVARTCVIMVGTLPILLLHFNIFSPVSILANLVMIPLVHIGLIQGFIAYLVRDVPLVSNLLVWSAEYLMRLIVYVADYLATFDWGYYYIQSPSKYAMLIYYLLLLLVVLVRSGRWNYPRSVKALSHSGLAVAFAVMLLPAGDSGMSLTFLSLGKTEAATLSVGNKSHWLINTGRGAPSNHGRWVVSPFLRSRGIKRLNGVILTDDMKKHWGAIYEIEASHAIDRLVAPTLAGALKNVKYKLCRDKTQCEFRPDLSDELEVLDLGNNSIAILISYRGNRFVMLSRVSPEVPEELQGQDVEGLFLPAMTENQFHKIRGNLKNWLKNISPQYVFSPYFSAVMEDFLRENNVAYWKTSEDGAIRIFIPETGIAEPELSVWQNGSFSPVTVG